MGIKQIPNYISNKILKAIDLINQWQSQSEDTILGYDGTTRLPLSEFNIGDLIAIVNGALVNNILMRTNGTLKEYNSSGALQNSQTIAQILLASLTQNSNSIEGLRCESNTGTPDEQVDVKTGKCLAKDKLTVLELTSNTTVDLTNHITPANSTTYHLYIYKHSGTGAILLDFSTSLTPTAGSGDANLPNLDGTKYRKILSLKTDASGDIVEFIGYLMSSGALNIRFKTAFSEGSVSAITASFTYTTMNTPLYVGINYSVLASISTQMIVPGASRDMFVEDGLSGQTIGILGALDSRPFNYFDIYIKDNGTLGFKSGVGNQSVSIWLHGYKDFRNNI